MNNNLMTHIYIYIFYWLWVSEEFASTNPGGAQSLGKEFPASVPWVIQRAIKFPQSDGLEGLNALKEC